MPFLEPGDPRVVVDSLIDTFARTYDGAPAQVAMAPGRVNVIGEHTDYNGGPCLPIALPHATWAVLGARSDDRVRIASVQQDGIVETRLGDLAPRSVRGWAAYVAGVVWALREDGHDLPGLDILVDSTVPLGAGLSSSAALECSVAVALVGCIGLDLDDDRRATLAEVCVRAETEMAGAPTGGMDQAISMSARAGNALLLDFGDGSRRQVPWDPASAGLRLLVIDTRASHELTDGGYGSRRDSCEEAARALGVASLRDVVDQDEALGRLSDPLVRRRARHVFTEIARVATAVQCLESGDWRSLGAALVGSHESLRDDYEVSCVELDVAVDTALAAGAWGARMTGGGFGGSAIALVEESAVEDTRAAVDESFAARGWPAPAYLDGVASDGARPLSL